MGLPAKHARSSAMSWSGDGTTAYRIPGAAGAGGGPVEIVITLDGPDAGLRSDWGVLSGTTFTSNASITWRKR